MPSKEPFISTLEEWINLFMHRSMRNFLHYARESGFSMSQLGALLHLHKEGCDGVTSLSDRLGVTSAATSQMVDRLVHQGLIQRTEDPDDRRVKQITLTEKGSEILTAGIQARQSWLNDLGDTLTEDEKEKIVEALRILIDKAEGFYQQDHHG